MKKADINNLSNEITEKQAKYLKETKTRYNGEILTCADLVKSLISEGYKLTEGNKNSFTVRNGSLSIILNAAEAKLFFWVEKGREGKISCIGYKYAIV